MKYLFMILVGLCVCLMANQDALANTCNGNCRRPVARAVERSAEVVRGTVQGVCKCGKACVCGAAKVAKGTARVVAKGTKAVAVGTAKVVRGAGRGVKRVIQRRPGVLIPKAARC